MPAARRPLVTHSRQGLALRTAVFAMVVVATSPCRDKKSPAANTASLVAAGRGVTIQRDGQSLAGINGLRLVVGDVLLTGSEGGADLGFEGGHALKLGSNSSAALERGPDGAESLTIMLNQGSARAVAGRHGPLLIIGTPFGRAAIGSGSEVEVGSDGAFNVILGTIEVTFTDGKKLTIPAGGRYPAAKAAAEPRASRSDVHMVIKPLHFSLVAKAKAAQIKRTGDKAWRPSQRRETLAPDDTVRTRRGASARLEIDTRATVLLHPDTEIVAKASGLTAEGSTAHLVLHSGRAKFLARREGNGAGRHEVEVGGGRVRIEPGADEANVDVSTNRDGRGQVVVHLGRAILPNGETVEAGNAVPIQKGAPDGASAPLATTFVDIRAGRRAEIWYSNRVPPVRFTWEPGTAEPPYAIELARDERFSSRVFKEAVHQPRFVYELLKPGLWFWRVQLAGTWQTGTVRVARDQNADCLKCRRLNVVEDTGRETTVYFQETLPAITLRWSPVAGATSYRVRLFAEHSLDRPRIDETVTTRELSLTASRLGEGTYAWSMQALGADKSALLTGAVNRLTIAYDNAVSGIRIRTPKPGAAIAGATARTSGEIALGERLAINGKPAAVDDKGRFSAKVTVRKGTHPIVYHLTGSGSRDRYWVRDVVGKGRAGR
jgi:hypothetical protein